MILQGRTNISEEMGQDGKLSVSHKIYKAVV